ncbi:hypothetical protein JI664_23700, partial [Rhodobacter sp. NTK016B]|uniref:hypothetical protein n=1 Tax=Rhodobacter sp. NTK016B TaxID=2759676 RepID=UPI001A8E6542
LPRRQASRTLTLPDLSVSALDGDQVLPSQALTFDAVGATSVVGTTLNLRYLERNPLPARWWSAITVTRDSDSAVLTAGVDYEVNQP